MPSRKDQESHSMGAIRLVDVLRQLPERELGSLIACISQSWFGSRPGANQAIVPSLSLSLPLGCQAMTSTRWPSPKRSA